jgi:hypothetical protein
MSEPGEGREFLVNNCPKGCVRERDIMKRAAIAAGMESFCAPVQL